MLKKVPEKRVGNRDMNYEQIKSAIKKASRIYIYVSLSAGFRNTIPSPVYVPLTKNATKELMKDHFKSEGHNWTEAELKFSPKGKSILFIG